MYGQKQYSVIRIDWNGMGGLVERINNELSEIRVEEKRGRRGWPKKK